MMRLANRRLWTRFGIMWIRMVMTIRRRSRRWSISRRRWSIIDISIIIVIYSDRIAFVNCMYCTTINNNAQHCKTNKCNKLFHIQFFLLNHSCGHNHLSHFFVFHNCVHLFIYSSVIPFVIAIMK